MKEVIIDIDPVPKPRMVKSDKWKGRPIVERWWRYKALLIAKANIKGGVKIGGTLSVVFVVPIPKSYYDKNSLIKKKHAESGVYEGAPHVGKPDLDNLLKGLKDVFCKDDSHVHTYRDIKKVWGKAGQIVILTEQ